MEDEAAGVAIARDWSKTARRLQTEFAVSVGLINGKRCLGGMLELMMHCHYLLATDETTLGMPEVTLPVVPGMEGCHWPFRRAPREHWPEILGLLLEGRSVAAARTVGWLFAGLCAVSLVVVLPAGLAFLALLVLIGLAVQPFGLALHAEGLVGRSFWGPRRFLAWEEIAGLRTDGSSGVAFLILESGGEAPSLWTLPEVVWDPEFQRLHDRSGL